MITLLCFGDSNTWGFDPATKQRIARDQRWPGVLRAALGPSYLVIEEGLNGRTTVWHDPVMPHRRGIDYLLPCLQTHKPLDIVVIMLGTNDLKKRFSASAYDISRGMALLADAVRKSDCGPLGGAPKLLIVSPPPISRLTELAEQFEGAADKSPRLPAHYRNVAAEFSCEFFDAGSVVQSSDLDGIHLDVASHEALGKAIASKIAAPVST